MVTQAQNKAILGDKREGCQNKKTHQIRTRKDKKTRILLLWARAFKLDKKTGGGAFCKQTRPFF